MQSYIVKQTVRNKNSAIYAYELIYVEDSNYPDNPGDEATAKAIETLFTQYNSDTVLGGKKAFITFTPNLLFRNVPHIFDPEMLIIQITDDVLLYPHAMQMVEKFRKQGYLIALKGFEFNSRYITALDNVDMVKLNFDRPEDSLVGTVEIAKRLNKKIVAYNIDDIEQYQAAMEMGMDYLQGRYIGTMIPQKIRKLNHMQGNFFRLLAAISKEEVDLDLVEEIIARDVTLTYSLIKLVNSAYFALRNKVDSVHKALVVLGIGQLKQWIYLLSFRSDDGMPSEFIKTSFLRGTLCTELLEYCSGLKEDMSESQAYLLGMFSTLESLMDMPIEDAVSELEISEVIVDGLLNQEDSLAAKLLRLIIYYENGDWVLVSNSAEELGIPLEVLSRKYFECMEEVTETWNALMSVSGGTVKEV